MQKLLFVPRINKNIKIMHGGNHGDKRNLDVLSECSILKESDIYMEKKSFLKKIWYFFTSPIPLCGSRTAAKKLINEIKESDFDIVFLNNSYFGSIIPKIKKSGVRVITFFHNLEYSYILAAEKRGVARFMKARAVKKAENFSLQFSDDVIFLNLRDKEDAKQTYPKSFGAAKTHIIPVSFEDQLTKSDIDYMKSADMETPPKALFYGAYFPPNYNGIKWFVDNVAEHTACEYEIAGKGFEECKDNLERENVRVIGTVADMKSHILASDFIVLPIFEGSGMKLKTAEALMMGKTVIGAPEAFEGYDIDYKKVGDLCRSKEEFIKSINELIADKSRKKYNTYSRESYEEKYTYEAARKSFEKVIGNDIQA